MFWYYALYCFFPSDMLKILQKYRNNTQVNLLNFWNQGLFWPFLQLLLLKLRKDGHTCWSTVHANILNGERRSKKMLSIRKIYFNFPWVLTKKYNWFVMQKLLIFQLCTFRKKNQLKFWAPCFCHCCEHKFTQGHHPSCWQFFLFIQFGVELLWRSWHAEGSWNRHELWWRSEVCKGVTIFSIS